MIPFFAWLAATRWAQYVLLGVLVSVALLGIRQHYINVGKEQGMADQQQVQANTGAQDVAAKRDDHVEVLAEQRKIIEQQNQVIEQAKANIQSLNAMLVSLATQRQQASQQVAGLTESQVMQIVERYTPRQLADCVTQLPLCEKQKEALTKQVTEEHSATEGFKVQFEARSREYDSLADLQAETEKAYVRLYNDTARPKRSPKCLWLWKCTKPHLEVPDPKELRK
jgi:chromosome segregation ATPase